MRSFTVITGIYFNPVIIETALRGIPLRTPMMALNCAQCHTTVGTIPRSKEAESVCALTSEDLAKVSGHVCETPEELAAWVVVAKKKWGILPSPPSEPAPGQGAIS